jgi:hypothetical protein
VQHAGRFIDHGDNRFIECAFRMISLGQATI